MSYEFKVDDRVTWNWVDNHISGTIIEVHTKDFDFKGQTHRASEDEPQYEVKSDETGSTAAHKAAALRKAND